MDYIQTNDHDVAVRALAQKVVQSLSNGKVLWLVCGGSNIPLSVLTMNIIRATATKEDLQNLTVALTDERYGPVDHADSNWQQLVESGFSTEGVTTIPILTGKPLEETVEQYAKKLQVVFDGGALVIGQFGIGADGHIAGILPHSSAVLDTHSVYAYEASPYTRITLTVPSFHKISVAYAFVFGSAKHAVVARLQNEDLPLAEMPSQILKQIPEVYLYTDQLEE